MVPDKDRLSPQTLLTRNRERAATWAQKAGADRVKLLMERAQRDLQARLVEAHGLNGPGADSFTATQLRIALEQVRAVLHPLKQGLGNAVVDLGKDAAVAGAQGTIDYLNAADKAYRGINQPIALDQAALLDRAVSGAESSILNRIYSDPSDPRRKGVLDRYGDAVVGKFEEQLQLRFVSQKPWAEVRQGLIDQSNFLSSHPRYWAERIVRTEVMNTNNRASAETIAGAQEELGDMCKILCATFDNRTAADSYAVHGQIRRPSEAFNTWTGDVMHSPARPNDREIVVPHRVCWPIPPNLTPRSDGEVISRWASEGRKGSPPPRPSLSTIDRALFGKTAAPEPKPSGPSPAQQPPGPDAGPVTAKPEPGSAGFAVTAPPVEGGAEPEPPRKTRQRGPKAPPPRSEFELPVVRTASPVGFVERPLPGHAAPVKVPMFSQLAKDELGKLAVEDLYAMPAGKDEHVKVEAWDLKAAKKKDPRPYEATLKTTGKTIDELITQHGETVQLRNMDLERVRATASTVDRRDVASYIAKPPRFADDDLPVIVKQGGELYLHHGHEQLMAQRLRGIGAGDRAVRLIDLDKAAPAPKVDPATWATSALDDMPPRGKKPDVAAQKKIREAFRDLVAGEGLAPREDRAAYLPELHGLPAKEHAGAGMNRFEVTKMPAGVLGVHSWNGRVSVGPSTNEDIRAGLGFLKKQASLGPLPTGVVEMTTRGLHVMIHEQIHGASPAKPDAYQGVGIGMEEAATEILARRTTRRLVGYDSPTGNVVRPLPTKDPATGSYMNTGRSYDNYIAGLLESVEKHTGAEDLHVRIENAAAKTRAWTNGEVYETPADAVRGFVRALDVKDEAAREALTKELLDEEHGPFKVEKKK